MGSRTVFFQSEKEFTQDDWVAFGRSQLFVSKLYWNENPDMDINIIELDNPSSSEHIIVEFSKANGRFCFCYRLTRVGPNVTWSKREQINFLAGISKQFKAELLAYDEGQNPYLFIHITPQGEVATVGIKTDLYNDKDELEIDEYYNKIFGGFAVENPLSKQEQQDVISMFVRVVGMNRLNSYTIDEMGNHFTTNRHQFERLKNFSWAYYIQPTGKTPWYSEEERSAELLNLLKAYSEQSGKPICAFPANSTSIENIPGGTDSESFCVVMTPVDTEQIIYKVRRKSW